MRNSVRLFGAAAVTAGLMAVGAPAFADSADNDGVNIGNDLNTIVAPVQTCSTSVTGVTTLLFGSPSTNNCVNAPLLDHPSAGG